MQFGNLTYEVRMNIEAIAEMIKTGMDCENKAFKSETLSQLPQLDIQDAIELLNVAQKVAEFRLRPRKSDIPKQKVRAI
jgi:hypothetical protein